MGCRSIIDVYLNYALELATQSYGQHDIGVFHEVALEHPNLPGVGPASGNMDFLIARVDGGFDLEIFGDDVVATDPFITIVEAKKGETIGDPSSKVQLIAQMLTLDYNDLRDRFRASFVSLTKV
jgi:hypothetical protein